MKREGRMQEGALAAGVYEQFARGVEPPYLHGWGGWGGYWARQRMTAQAEGCCNSVRLVDKKWKGRKKGRL